MKQRYISAQKDPPHPNLIEGEGSALNCKLFKPTLNYYLLSINSKLFKLPLNSKLSTIIYYLLTLNPLQTLDKWVRG